jgi:hypothetical protein
MTTGETDQQGGVALAGEALHLLRTAPPRALLCYFAGTLPFITGLLYFWADMSRSAFARQRCFPAAFALAVGFIWMKSWQACFAGVLRDTLTGRASSPLDARGVARLVARQAVLQPYGLVVIPFAFLLLVPFFHVYAFYQNLTALGCRPTDGLRPLARKAMGLSLYRPKQNTVLIWLLSPWVLGLGLLVAFGSVRMAVSLSPELHAIQGAAWFVLALILTSVCVLPISPFGCVVAGNIALMLFIGPSLLRSLLGVQTHFVLSGWHAVFNSTFLAGVYCLSYLCLDPVIKAAYCLRCFQAESETTGEDLIAQLGETP